MVNLFTYTITRKFFLRKICVTKITRNISILVIHANAFYWHVLKHRSQVKKNNGTCISITTQAHGNFQKLNTALKTLNVSPYLGVMYGSDVLVQSYIHIKKLFSVQMMEEMDEEAECIEPVIANCSSRKSSFSSIDGTCNNKFRPTEGASNTGFTRLLPTVYFDADGLNDPVGYPDQPNAPSVPSPHKVSRNFIKDEVVASSRLSDNSHALMQFGQFIDHDLDLAVEVEFEGENVCLNVP